MSARSRGSPGRISSIGIRATRAQRVRSPYFTGDAASLLAPPQTELRPHQLGVVGGVLLDFYNLVLAHSARYVPPVPVRANAPADERECLRESGAAEPSKRQGACVTNPITPSRMTSVIART